MAIFNGTQVALYGNVTSSNGGLSDEAVDLLIEILSDAVYGSEETYTQKIPQLYAMLGGGEIPCTGITLSRNSLSIKEGNTFTLTATVTPDWCTDTISWTSSDDDVATVTGGVVHGVSDGSATITATCGDYSATCAVTVEETITHTITTNLTHMTSSSDIHVVEENEYYSTVLSVDEDCEVISVIVTMGGDDITEDVYSATTGNVLITEVTDDVVITGIASEVAYIDDLCDADAKITAVKMYTDEGITPITPVWYSDYSAVYPKFNVAQEATFTVEITNISENEISTNNIGVGSLPVEINGGELALRTEVSVYNGRNIKNSSGKLASGEKITATVTVGAGRRPVVIYYYSLKDSISVSMKGAYVEAEIAGEKVTFTQGQYAYGRKYYKGSTTSSGEAYSDNNTEYYNNTLTFSASKQYRITGVPKQNGLTTNKIGLETALKSIEVFNTPPISNYKTANQLPYIWYTAVMNGLDDGILTTTTNMSLSVEYYIEEVTA